MSSIIQYVNESLIYVFFFLKTFSKKNIKGDLDLSSGDSHGVPQRSASQRYNCCYHLNCRYDPSCKHPMLFQLKWHPTRAWKKDDSFPLVIAAAHLVPSPPPNVTNRRNLGSQGAFRGHGVEELWDHGTGTNEHVVTSTRFSRLP